MIRKRTAKKKNKRKLRSPGHIQKKRRLLYIRLGVAVAVLVVLIIGLVFAARADRLQIAEIKVSGAHVVEREEVERVVAAELAGDRLFIIPNTNVVLIDEDHIARMVKDEFPRVFSVDVSVNDVQTLTVHLEEREPFALWCEIETEDVSEDEENMETEGRPDATPETCYFLDQTGVIFADAPYFSGSTFFRFYGELTVDDPLGVRFRERDQFSKLVRFKNELDALELDPQEMHLGRGSEAHVVIWSRSNELLRGTRVLFDTNDNLFRVAENIEVILSDKIFDPIVTGETEPFETIDARFDDRVFYKRDSVE